MGSNYICPFTLFFEAGKKMISFMRNERKWVCMGEGMVTFFLGKIKI